MSKKLLKAEKCPVWVQSLQNRRSVARVALGRLGSSASMTLPRSIRRRLVTEIRKT